MILHTRCTQTGSDPQRVTRDSTERSAEWLTSALAAEPAVIAQRLPLDIAAHLALIAHLQQQQQEPDSSSSSTTSGTASSSSSEGWSLALRTSLAEPLLARLERHVWGSDVAAARRALELLCEVR
jgi:hypothetical protein